MNKLYTKGLRFYRLSSIDFDFIIACKRSFKAFSKIRQVILNRPCLQLTYADAFDMRSLSKKNIRAFHQQNKDIMEIEDGVKNDKEVKNEAEIKEEPGLNVVYDIKNQSYPSLFSDNEFTAVRADETFVDKTEFIKEVIGFTLKAIYMISGPKRWGKTVNLRSLFTFFAIVQDHPSRQVDPLKNPNRKVFENTKIMEDKDVFDKHFGRYPVIYLNFININVDSHNKIIDALYSKSWEIMKTYKYLLKDPYVVEEHADVFNRLNEKSLPNIIMFYKDLCILLYQYYGISPVILIDEYDHPIREIMRKYPEGEDYKNVLKIFQNFYVEIFKENEHRSYSIFTGIDRLTKARVFSPLNLEEELIISGDLVEYYSFTESDVEELLNKLEYTKHAHNEIKKAFKDIYNGYLIADKMIYNCFSIVKALKKIKKKYNNKPIYTESRDFKDNVLQCYWYQSYPLTNILNAFKSWKCSELFYHILKEKTISSPLEYLSDSENELRMVRTMYSISQSQADPSGKKKIIYDMDIVLSFLVAHGYLTKKPNDEGIYDVSIPNVEMRKSLIKFHKFLNLEMMKEDEKNVMLAMEYINQLHLSENVDLEKNIRNIFNNLVNPIFRSLHSQLNLDSNEGYRTTVNEAKLANILSGFIPQSKDYSTFFDYTFERTKGRPDILFIHHKSQVAVVIEIKYQRNIDEAYNQSNRYVSEIIEIKKLPKISKIIRIAVNFNITEGKLIIMVKCSIHKVENSIVNQIQEYENQLFESTVDLDK